MISVIIPTYNRSSFLKRSIESVLSQTYQNFELIVCDDGSNDNSFEIIKKYLSKITYIKQSNKGVSAARNLGIKVSSNPYIAFLDSDDEWQKDKLSKQADFFNKNPQSLLVHTDEEWIRNGKIINKKLIHQKSGNDLFEKSLNLCLISPSSVCMKKSLFTKFGLFAEDLPACEDYDLWLRLTAFINVDFIPEKLTIRYAGHNDQLSEKHWGMDRFRITSLTRLLEQGGLSKNKEEATLAILKKKITILLNGAKKRSNKDLITYCNRLKEAYLNEY